MERYEIPFWEKYTLSIEEAAAYFRIGENKIRKMINDNRDADYILWTTTRARIKRQACVIYNIELRRDSQCGIMQKPHRVPSLA